MAIWLVLTNRIWGQVICVASGPRLLIKEECEYVCSLQTCSSSASWIYVILGPERMRGVDTNEKILGSEWPCGGEPPADSNTPPGLWASYQLLPCHTMTCLSLFITAVWSTLNNIDRSFQGWDSGLGGQRRCSPNLCAHVLSQVLVTRLGSWLSRKVHVIFTWAQDFHPFWMGNSFTWFKKQNVMKGYIVLTLIPAPSILFTLSPLMHKGVAIFISFSCILLKFM